MEIERTVTELIEKNSYTDLKGNRVISVSLIEQILKAAKIEGLITGLRIEYAFTEKEYIKRAITSAILDLNSLLSSDHKPLSAVVKDSFKVKVDNRFNPDIIKPATVAITNVIQPDEKEVIQPGVKPRINRPVRTVTIRSLIYGKLMEMTVGEKFTSSRFTGMDFDDVNPATIQVELSAHVKAGNLERVSPGLYKKLSHEHKILNHH